MPHNPPSFSDDPVSAAAPRIKSGAVVVVTVIGKGLRHGAVGAWRAVRWSAPRVWRWSYAQALDLLHAGSKGQRLTGMDCSLCGSAKSLHQTTITTRDTGGQLFGCAIFLAALVIGIVFIFTIIIPIICILVAFGALLMGAKRSKVWKCKVCNAIVARG